MLTTKATIMVASAVILTYEYDRQGNRSQHKDT